MNEFKCVSIHPSSPSPNSSDQVTNAVYEVWKENWFSLFDEIEHAEYMCSDEFSKQHEILSIFYKGDCLGCVGFRHINLKHSYWLDDSYLRIWPEEFLKRFKERSASLTLMSGFNLNSKFRLRVLKMPTLHLFGSYIMLKFLSLSSNQLITVARNDAGVNKFAYKYGARKISGPISFHGKDCDLVAFNRHATNPYPYPKYQDVFATILNDNISNLTLKTANA